MANPALNDKTISKFDREAYGIDSTAGAMTVSGTINKAGLLFVILLVGAFVGWGYADQPVGQLAFLGSMIAALVLSLVIIFKNTTAPTLAPFYALFEGVFLGGISAMFSRAYPGIAANAATLTILVMFLMLGLYHFKILQATPRFQKIVIMSTMAIGLLYLVDLIAGMMSHPMPMIHETGMVGIGFSVVVVGIAAMNLILDFDMVERAARARAPKYFEWYSAFALMLTLVWLYFEILRLLSKLNKR